MPALLPADMYFLANDVPESGIGGGIAVRGSLGGVGVWLGVEESCRKCADASDDDADATLPIDEFGVELEGPV